MNKLRLLFCTPPYHPYHLADEKVYIVEPLQFEVLSSLLDKTRFEIDVLDLRLERRSGVLERKLASFRPDIFVISCWTLHLNQVREALKTVKDFDSNVVTVVGGEHTRINPADLAIAQTDFIWMGEGYQGFSDLINYIYDGDNGYRHLNGLAYQENGRFISNGQAVVHPNFDLDTLPFPDRSITKKYHKQYYHLWWKPIATMRTAMGCPARCSFCNLWKVNAGKFLGWSPEYIADYISTLEEPYILFVDDHCFGDLDRSFALGEALLKKGIQKQYCLYSRADTIAENPELIELWAAVGLKRVRMGLESYSDDTLSSMNKHASVDSSSTAIKILKKHGVLTEGLFQIGLDYTYENFQGMLKYIRDQEIEVPNITVSTPMPGTVEYTQAQDQIVYKEPEYFDFQHAVMETTLDIKTFCHEYSMLMIRAQRPPQEQIRLMGLRKFIMKMPNFWRYFWSLRTSYKHYLPENRVGSGNGKTSDLAFLPWVKNYQNLDPQRQKEIHTIERLYREEMASTQGAGAFKG
ncbi:MAG: cobalamin-dependent protein [Cyanobacteria bacterium SID2]|nr:cobalamin-dependent protein [Cyanobacteria bacterium SID2]